MSRHMEKLVGLFSRHIDHNMITKFCFPPPINVYYNQAKCDIIKKYTIYYEQSSMF